MVIRLGAGRYMLQIPAGPRKLFLLQNTYTGSGTHVASFSMGLGVLSRG
jgi:hypothetical protein